MRPRPSHSLFSSVEPACGERFCIAPRGLMEVRKCFLERQERPLMASRDSSVSKVKN
ncbi:hypothetical protein EMIT048CA2_50260 [Pseudomonas chlororaphis]